MANAAIPRMTKPWKVVAVAMAVFGFVYGYVGSAGHLCGTLGSCFQDVADRGLAGFDPASLVPGAIDAALFAAVVYLLFLPVYGVRKAFHLGPAARDGRNQSARPTAAGLKGPKHRARPTPLLVAAAAALAWAIVSVGPASLADDLGALIPSDTVTAPHLSCTNLTPGWVPEGSRCTPEPLCGNAAPEADGMCHERTGGAVDPLIGDVLRGGQNGLLAFLAIGAALLLWPRLRAASLRPIKPRPE